MLIFPRIQNFRSQIRTFAWNVTANRMVRTFRYFFVKKTLLQYFSACKYGYILQKGSKQLIFFYINIIIHKKFI
jgi:hypothetical protein